MIGFTRKERFYSMSRKVWLFFVFIILMDAHYTENGKVIIFSYLPPFIGFSVLYFYAVDLYVRIRRIEKKLGVEKIRWIFF